MGLKPLTDRQREVLDAIARLIRERGYPPSFREIGAAIGIASNNGVNDHLDALERKGYIERDGFRSRAIRIVEKGVGE